jgi:hypothetical protein
VVKWRFCRGFQEKVRFACGEFVVFCGEFVVKHGELMDVFVVTKNTPTFEYLFLA